ncbi:precorrin-3B synthase [freshwater sediment metagenome]|uniref:Precorrin-3B synthase n=1 Tax=freshwater sediment metagenome TaxID=556182 RepID=A0AA48LXX7_9ZZZZ
MQPTPEIKGWCPGAFAPMQSNDGLLIRAKVIGSRVSSEQLAALAAIAEDCGNGLVDLSQRAQLQLRGVSEATLSGALARLDAAGLLPRNANAERVTNIVAAPLAGLDRTASFDANSLAKELAQALQADVLLRALPAKFLFVIDDGGALSLQDVEADIRIEAEGGGVAIGIAGAEEHVAASVNEAVAVALELARAFVAMRAGEFEQRRMRSLVAAIGAEAVFSKAGLTATPNVRSKVTPAGFLGARDANGLFYAGVAAPSGRWQARALRRLAALADEHGLGELRLTPWRAFLLPSATLAAARKIAAAAGALDLIVSQDDPRLAVVACPGAPECPQAQGETRIHLARLAPLAQKLAGADGVGLHISGCAKGCARPRGSTVTLVLNNGHFDLVDRGRASDTPHLRGLTIDAAESALAARAEEYLCLRP